MIIDPRRSTELDEIAEPRRRTSEIAVNGVANISNIDFRRPEAAVGGGTSIKSPDALDPAREAGRVASAETVTEIFGVGTLGGVGIVEFDVSEVMLVIVRDCQMLFRRGAGAGVTEPEAATLSSLAPKNLNTLPRRLAFTLGAAKCSSSSLAADLNDRMLRLRPPDPTGGTGGGFGCSIFITTLCTSSMYFLSP